MTNGCTAYEAEAMAGAVGHRFDRGVMRPVEVGMVAALYVEPNGCYVGVPSVDPWDEARDARKYSGPHPVVCHSPCQRWGKFWHGSTRKPHQYRLGEDGGCFAAALTAVRNYGGVLEHPADSLAWAWFGLRKPKRGEGWVQADAFGCMTCYVEQGRYGHASRKPTWRSKMVDEFARAAAEQTCDDGVRRCPYCKHEYQPEAETYSEDVREEECERCGKSYRLHDSFSVTHYATPDCELNGEAHDWQPRAVRGGRMHPFCMKCDKCMPMSLVA